MVYKPTNANRSKTLDSYGKTLGRSRDMNGIFVGFVKKIDDQKRMGRLHVWIPELGGEPDNPSSWYLCNYASPFAGATNMYDLTEQNTWEVNQKSYGFWFIPPDLENEVLVCFANQGNTARAYWFACLYQQQMNHMVPGIPGNNSQASLPVVEYNKLSETNVESPNRPIYTPFADSLKRAGLDKDPVRGLSTSGARRDNPPNSVYGILTPGGSQFVMDDNPQQKLIRLRTIAGSQILLDDASGSIYLSTKDGNNWFELSAGGEVEFYGKSDISIRTQGSLNIRADFDLNLEAGRNINMKARGDVNQAVDTGPSVKPEPKNGGNIYIYGTNNVQVTSGNTTLIRAENEIHVSSKKDMFVKSDEGNYDTWIKGYIHTETDDQVTFKVKKNFGVKSERVDLNGPPMPDAKEAQKGLLPIDTTQKDNYIQSDGSTFSFIVRDSISYRLPYHEPYDYHGGQVPGTNEHVEEQTGSVRDLYNGQIIKPGAVTPNQDQPLKLFGSPKQGMQPGLYEGNGYTQSGEPLYKYSAAPGGALNSAGGYQISENGLRFIRQWEGSRATVYDDVVGLKTIGVGHLMKPEELSGRYTQVGGTQVPWSQALSDQQINDLLRQDLQPKEQAVRGAVKVSVTQAQYDMMVSLCFNIGQGAFKGSTLVKTLNQGNFDDATNQFMKWTKAKGQIIQGLVNRRRAEAANFRGDKTAPV